MTWRFSGRLPEKPTTDEWFGRLRCIILNVTEILLLLLGMAALAFVAWEHTRAIAHPLSQATVPVQMCAQDSFYTLPAQPRVSLDAGVSAVINGEPGVGALESELGESRNNTFRDSGDQRIRFVIHEVYLSSAAAARIS